MSESTSAEMGAVPFDPTNHHNAGVCPYCTHNGAFVMTPAYLLDKAMSLLRAVAVYEDDATTGPWPEVLAFLSQPDGVATASEQGEAP